MENVTDKELLTICNLSNLKMEFADLIAGEEIKTIEKDGKKEVIKNYINHTIYSLLNEEVNRMKTRIELELENKSLDNNINYGTFIQYTGDTEKSENELKKEYIYYSKEALIREAPLVMEYYDSYCEAKDKKIIKRL